MPGFSSAIGNAVKSGFCGFLANQSAIEYAFGDAIGNTYDAAGQPLSATWWSNVACDKPPPAPIPPPFLGGQCPLVSYRITGSYTYDQPPFGEQTFPYDVGTVLGAVRYNGFRLDGNDWKLLFVTEITPQNPQGVDSPVFILQQVPPGGGTARTLKSATVTVTRVDGQPDNCGNPPVQPPSPLPPGGNVTNTNVTYTTNDGVDVTVPVVLVYGQAFIDVNANVTIPITVNVNATANFTANFNLSTGGISLSPGSDSGRKRNADDSCDGGGNKGRRIVGNPPPTPVDPPTPPNEPDDTESIVGVIVTTTNLESAKPTIIFQQDNPDIYAPSLGYVNFLISVDNGNTQAWTQDIPVKNRRQIIQCPWDGGALDVRATPIPGVEFTLNAIKREARTPKPIQ